MFVGVVLRADMVAKQGINLNRAKVSESHHEVRIDDRILELSRDSYLLCVP